MQLTWQTLNLLLLNVKLTFNKHLSNVLNKVKETIGLLRKLNLLSRSALITIYKAFVRPHLDNKKRENISRTWFWFPSSSSLTQKTLDFFEVLKNKLPQYLFNLISVSRTLYSTRKALNILLLNTNPNFFKILFFPSTIIELNKLDPELGIAESLLLLKTNIIKTIWRRLGLSHLREYKLKHNFQDTINPLCTCVHDINWAWINWAFPSVLHYPQFVNETCFWVL